MKREREGEMRRAKMEKAHWPRAMHCTQTRCKMWDIRKHSLFVVTQSTVTFVLFGTNVRPIFLFLRRCQFLVLGNLVCMRFATYVGVFWQEDLTDTTERVCLVQKTYEMRLNAHRLLRAFHHYVPYRHIQQGIQLKTVHQYPLLIEYINKRRCCCCCGHHNLHHQQQQQHVQSFCFLETRENTNELILYFEQ